MKRYMFILITNLCFFISHAQLFIKNATIVDVENRKLLHGYSVRVDNGLITAVGKEIVPQAGAQVIDGSGKWLSPGFVDAHVHFFQSGGLYARPDAIDLRKYQPYDKELKFVHDNMDDLLDRYMATGITSVIDVGASLNFLQQRDSLAQRPVSPVISMTGPLLTTWLPAPYKDLGNESPFALMHSKDDAVRF